MGARPPSPTSVSPKVNADFTIDPMPLPPGVETVPSFRTDIPRPSWLSPVASRRLDGVGDTKGHLVVGGRTVWVRSGQRPSAIVVSHPNRLGSAEDLSALVALGRELGASVHVEVDPLLVAVINLPPEAWPTVEWSAARNHVVQAAADRAQQAAVALRRRLAQVKGLIFPVEHPLGRTTTVVVPTPGDRVAEVLAAAGARLNTVEYWEGGLSMTVGWWHTRQQIDALAAAVGAVLSGGDCPRVPPDRFDRIPDDLPRRHPDTIPFL
jgi:hypothetical protein